MSLGSLSSGANVDNGWLRNLVVVMNATNPAYQVDVTADMIQIENIVVTAFSKTADITVSGANGLDTGAEAISTWYYLYAIAKVDGTVASLLSASSTAPVMPTGYTKKRRLCAIRNNASGNFVELRKKGAWVLNVDTIGVQRPLSGGVATSFTAVDCSTFVPPTSTRAWVHLFMNPSHTVVGAQFSCYIKPNGSTVTNGFDSATVRIANASTEAPVQTQCAVDTDATQSIAYKISVAPDVGGGVYIDILGYYEDV